MRLLMILALGATALVGCRQTDSDMVVGTGTISGSIAECSSWFIHADSGRWYELTSLPSTYQHPNLRVRFGLKRRSDVASICMAGETVDLVWIVRS